MSAQPVLSGQIGKYVSNVSTHTLNKTNQYLADTSSEGPIDVCLIKVSLYFTKLYLLV